jgi:hypothetical protein
MRAERTCVHPKASFGRHGLEQHVRFPTRDLFAIAHGAQPAPLPPAREDALLFCLGPDDFIPKPKRVFLTPFHGVELESYSCFAAGLDAVEHSRNFMPPVDAGYEQNAYFVNKVSLEKGPVNVTSAFEQQPANSKVIAEQVHGFDKVNRRLAGDEVGDAQRCSTTSRRMNSSYRVRTGPQGHSPYTSRVKAKSYAISVDTTGKLQWEGGDLDGDHLICVVSERVPEDYLYMLRDVVRPQIQASPSSFAPVVS